jgi:tetratricopeptide (TPR) repeat protein
MIYRLTGVAMLSLLVCALNLTGRLERADWFFIKGTSASIRQAIALAPGTAEYYSSLAQTEPGHAVEILQEAVAWNPLHSGLRIELGMAQEQLGDFASAEKSLLEAAKLDTGFAPRWALSDFYFHRRDAAKFWPTVKSALNVSYGDPVAQFRQCWEMTSDAPAILERAIPDRPAMLREYLDFLLTEGRLDAAAPVAGRVLATADRAAAPSLLNYCDRMLAQWRGQEALEIWNGMVKRNLVTESGRGFDLRIATPPGVHADRMPGSGVVLRFSGNQPESTEILSQYVPLLPCRRYVLSAQYGASGIPADSGVIYSLQLPDGRDLFAVRAPGDVPFQTPEGATLGRLVLAYRRVPGTVRIEGTLTLEKFALSLAEN